MAVKAPAAKITSRDTETSPAPLALVVVVVGVVAGDVGVGALHPSVKQRHD